VFLMAFLSFIGWFFWTFFVGVGLVALPLDLINEWRTRPEPMPTKVYFEEKEKLGKRAIALIDAGQKIRDNADLSRHKQLSRTERAKARNLLIRFEQAFYLLKRDRDLLMAAAAMRGTDFNKETPLNLNPLWYGLKAFCGMIGAVISLAWVIHIIVFILPQRPLTPFLNNFFIVLEGVAGGSFPLFGVLAFAIFGMWLLWCVIKGNFRLGLRLACVRIYPVELGKTKMDSFLANTWVLLLCSVPTVQFCVFAFPYYCRDTQVDILFGTQIMYIKYLEYFWENNVFIFALLVVVIISAVVLIIRPVDKAESIEKELQAIASRPLNADS